MTQAYAVDTGLLILRLCLGITLAAHGFNKFFGGGRIPGTARWFESIGMKPGTFHARIAATTEVAAGLGDHVRAHDLGVAGIGPEQRGEHPDRRRLPRSVRP